MSISLVSSALTPRAVEALFQPLVASILGLDAINDPNSAYSAVRIGWQTEGQPGWEVTDDVCVITSFLEDDPFSRVRDSQYQMTGSPETILTEEMSYTQVWKMHFCFYGPTSAGNARRTLSSISLDWVMNSLQTSGLYVIPEWHPPVYAPELFPDPGGVWYERTDLEVRFNEQVSESVTPISDAASVEVTISTPRIQSVWVTKIGDFDTIPDVDQQPDFDQIDT